jgi:hypothetical protein
MAGGDVDDTADAATEALTARATPQHAAKADICLHRVTVPGEAHSCFPSGNAFTSHLKELRIHDRTLPDPPGSPTSHPDPHQTARPTPAHVVTVLPYLLNHRPAAAALFVMAYSPDGEPFAIGSPTLETSDIPTAAALLEGYLDEQDARGGQLIAYTGPDSVTALRRVAATAHPHLREVVRVHEGRWWHLTSPDLTDLPAEGQEIPTDLDAIDSAMLAVAGAFENAAAASRPGPPRGCRLRCVSTSRASPTRATPSGPLTRQHLFTIIHAERAARRNRPMPLEPAHAAQLLLA